jgi:hypothetical protein
MACASRWKVVLPLEWVLSSVSFHSLACPGCWRTALGRWLNKKEAPRACLQRAQASTIYWGVRAKPALLGSVVIHVFRDPHTPTSTTAVTAHLLKWKPPFFSPFLFTLDHPSPGARVLRPSLFPPHDSLPIENH